MLKENHLSFKSKATGEIIIKTAQFTKSLTVSLGPEVFKKIEQITDANRISMGEWVRVAVEAALEKVK